MRTSRWARAFALWTLFVWTGRVVNVARDGALSGAGKAAGIVFAGTFVALAIAVLVRPRRPAVAALAGWTVAVWAVRSVAIVLHDHSTPFVVVHVALAAVSTVLAVVAVRGSEADVERERQAPAAATGLEELVDG